MGSYHPRARRDTENQTPLDDLAAPQIAAAVDLLGLICDGMSTGLADYDREAAHDLRRAGYVRHRDGRTPQPRPTAQRREVGQDPLSPSAPQDDESRALPTLPDVARCVSADAAFLLSVLQTDPDRPWFFGVDTRPGLAAEHLHAAGVVDLTIVHDTQADAPAWKVTVRK